MRRIETHEGALRRLSAFTDARFPHGSVQVDCLWRDERPELAVERRRRSDIDLERQVRFVKRLLQHAAQFGPQQRSKHWQIRPRSVAVRNRVRWL